jgi:hypothetical protein
MSDVIQFPPRTSLNLPADIKEEDKVIFAVSREVWEGLPQDVWQCNCRGQLFYLNKDGPRCASCGLFAQSWIDT